MWGNSVKTFFIAVYFRQLVTNKGLTYLVVSSIYVHHTRQTRAGLSLYSRDIYKHLMMVKKELTGWGYSVNFEKMTIVSGK